MAGKVNRGPGGEYWQSLPRVHLCTWLTLLWEGCVPMKPDIISTDLYGPPYCVCICCSVVVWDVEEFLPVSVFRGS